MALPQKGHTGVLCPKRAVVCLIKREIARGGWRRKAKSWLCDFFTEFLPESLDQINPNVFRKNNRQFQSALFSSHEAYFDARINGLQIRRPIGFLFCHRAILGFLKHLDKIQCWYQGVFPILCFASHPTGDQPGHSLSGLSSSGSGGSDQEPPVLNDHTEEDQSSDWWLSSQEPFFVKLCRLSRWVFFGLLVRPSIREILRECCSLPYRHTEPSFTELG